MQKLISKVQYKNFEPGEFIDVQERDYNETILLIENFQWDVQRDRIIIDLTNPSITIEGNNNDYLKFAIFFNEKYVLHYFDDKQTLFTKSFYNLSEGYGYIKNYFEQPSFDVSDFKKENTWAQHNLKHFVTQDFRYMLTPSSIRNYLLRTSGMNFVIAIVLLSSILLKGDRSLDPVLLLLFLPFIFFFGGGLHLMLFFNYYNYVKDKILSMSKGNDDFYFGEIDNPKKYNKKDISEYEVIKIKSSRNPLSDFGFVVIIFKDTTILKIPNLLVDDTAMEQKLFEYKKIEVNKFPWMKREL